jgi:hypothetical protein
LRGHPARLTILKLFAILVLIAQFGLVAHRIEHYLVPDQMECGEDFCDAFAPGSGAVSVPVYLPPVFFIVFFLRFWALRDAARTDASDRLGFRAHAPPF